jgi:hypothetical protein
VKARVRHEKSGVVSLDARLLALLASGALCAGQAAGSSKSTNRSSGFVRARANPKPVATTAQNKTMTTARASIGVRKAQQKNAPPACARTRMIGNTNATPGQLITGEGSNLRAIYNSFTARDGLLAALMAGRGIGGISDVFEGKRGLFNIYFKGQYDRDFLLADLGKVYTGTDVSFKQI